MFKKPFPVVKVLLALIPLVSDLVAALGEDSDGGRRLTKTELEALLAEFGLAVAETAGEILVDRE